MSEGSHATAQGQARRLLPELLLQAVVTLGCCFTCVLAFWLVPLRAGVLLSTSLEAAGGPKGARSRTKTAGALWVGGATLVVTAAVIASAPPWVRGPTRQAIAMVLGVLLPAGVGAACAPFALAPFALLDGAAGVGPAIGRAFELAARRGVVASVRDSAVLGGAVGALLQLVTVTVHHAPGTVGLGISLLVRAALVVVTVAGSTFLLARIYVAATEGPKVDTEPRLAPRLRTIFALMVPALAALGAALMAALVVPAPMGVVSAAQLDIAAEQVADTDRRGEYLELAGPHGLRVRSLDRGVSIETADGGGAGFVESGAPHSVLQGCISASNAVEELEAYRYDGSRCQLTVFREPFRGHVAYVAHLGGGGSHPRIGTAVVRFDEEGVRLDDSLSDRLAARLGRNTLGALLLALLLATAWGLRLLRALVEARELDAIVVSATRPAPAGVPSRLLGRLRLGAGSTLVAHGTAARMLGDARIVSRDGDIVLALPEEVRLFAPFDGRAPSDGDEVEVVGHLGGLTPTGLREGALPWPHGARLLLGSHAEAADRVVSRAARGGALVAAIVALSIVTVALSIVTAL